MSKEISLAIERYMYKNEKATLKQISDEFGDNYYHNGKKHIGTVLTRLVKNKVLKRSYRGEYIYCKDSRFV